MRPHNLYKFCENQPLSVDIFVNYQQAENHLKIAQHGDFEIVLSRPILKMLFFLTLNNIQSIKIGGIYH